jgi:hypothetical protein
MLVSIVIIASVMMFYATIWGIGVSPDSTVYIWGARSLLQGNKFCLPSGSPITHYPPLYSLLLTLPELWGIDLLEGARVLHMLLFACNVLLVGSIISRNSSFAFLAYFLGCILMLSSPTMLHIHSMAWSEPLFLLLTLSSFFYLAEHLALPRPGFLFLSSLLLGLACLTRFVGMAFIITGIGGIFLLPTKRTFSGKCKEAGIFGIASSIPLILWLIRNKLIGGTLANRTIAYHPITLKHIKEMASTIVTWVYPPHELPTFMKAALLLGVITIYLVVFFIVFKKRKIARRIEPATRMTFFPGLAVLLFPAYLMFLFLSISFADAQTPLDLRMLSPLYVFGLSGMLVLVSSVCSYHKRKTSLWIWVFLGCAVFSGLQLVRTRREFMNMFHNGRYYAGKRWKLSQAVEIVKSLPHTIPFYSNCPDALSLLTGKNSSMIPYRVFPFTRQENPELKSHLAAMMKQLEEQDGVLVYMKMITWRWYLPTNDYLKETLPLRILYEGSDGVIYEAADRTDGRWETEHLRETAIEESPVTNWIIFH